MDKILKTLLKRLTNIGSGNRSVFLSRLYREQFLDLHRLDYRNNSPSFQLIVALISGKKKILLCDEVDSRDSAVNEISKGIKRIARREKLVFEESGARDLYVGWPFVKGKLLDGSPIRCPLILFPVTITLENGKWYLEQRTDTDFSFNKNFFLAYAHFNSVSISDEWIESVPEEFDHDILSFRTQLYEHLKKSPLELNFNQDLFSDKLQDFKEYTAQDFDNTYATGQLKLFPEAVLGIFPQAGSYLVPDYEALIERKEFTDLENFFQAHTSDENGLIREETNYLAYTLDASQEKAILKVKEGKSIVIQGPPGTGKSQVICNLISDFTARRKKVLLVCQKRAALDVVYERLKEKQIHPFIALVHDFRNDRSKIFDQIRDQIEKTDDYRKENNGLDTIYLERGFSHTSRQIALTTQELADFHQALYRIDEFGISVKELYLTSSYQTPHLSLQEYTTAFDLNSSLEFEKKIRSYIPLALRFMNPEYSWYHRPSFAHLYNRDEGNIRDTILKIPQYKKQLNETACNRIRSDIKNYTPDFFTRLKNPVEKINTSIREEDDFFLLLKLMKAPTDLQWLKGKQEKITSAFQKEGPEIFLDASELDTYRTYITHYEHSQKKFFRKIFWNIFSNERRALKNILQKYQLSLTDVNVDLLRKRIVRRKNYEKHKASLVKSRWVSGFPEKIRRQVVDEWFTHYSTVLEAKAIIENSEELSGLIQSCGNDYRLFQDNFHYIPALAGDVEENHRQWSKYLAPEMIEGLLQETLSIPELLEDLKRDFDLLVESDKQKEGLLAYEKKIMQLLLRHDGTTSVEEKVALFRNSIRLQWIGHLEEKYPVLRSVSNLKMNQWEKQLQEALEEKMKISRDILQLRLREGTYRNVEYNRLQNRTTYRDLFHQVTKKKKLWPLRRILTEFSDELSDLIPCWMVSPESVSALFPLQKTFDLVIFDEASQCFSEQGLPAMYRGKQIVIAGDSKQLKPNDLYQARWEDENEDIPDLEIDSLLDLSEKYLPSVQLHGHYRSRHPDLIDFSNRHFYKNKLQLIPYAADINHYTPSIKYIRAHGQWENNTNPGEALEVTRLAASLIQAHREKSIGIITFNFRQSQLITDILEQHCIENNILIPDTLFIRNIENVQGDERDIILFSVGYAPDKNGRFHMQFGSLNQEGGENRLNVAVTRAREKIYVVASIMPQQLTTEESMHEGPKLLKKYLEYAWNVSEGNYQATPSEGLITSREWYLSRRIAEKNNHTEALHFEEEFPFADITVKKSGRYEGLIFTDDYPYYTSENPKEFHAFIPMHLKQKGWHSARYFSRDWWLGQPVPFSVF